MILEHDAMFISVLSIFMKRVNFCCPLAELGSSFRFYAVADRYYRIEIIILHRFCHPKQLLHFLQQLNLRSIRHL
jgi:hypothetical protein